MNEFDKYYPESDSMKTQGVGIVISLKAKLQSHLRKAMSGDREAESKLCNRLGQIRRNFPDKFPDWLKEEFDQAVPFLRSVGRTINFKSSDPRYWISQRGGYPRW